MDLTVCDPMQKALIEQHFGEQVSNAPPQLLIHLAQRFKSLGNTAVRQKQFQGQWLSLHNVICTPYSSEHTETSSLSVCRSCQVLQPGHSCGRARRDTLCQPFCCLPCFIPVSSRAARRCKGCATPSKLAQRILQVCGSSSLVKCFKLGLAASK